MKILAFCDTHGSIKSLNSIKEKTKNENPEVVICSGDISQFENSIMTLLKTINDFGKPVMIIHGNHESEEMFNKLKGKFKNIFYIHNSSYALGDVLFIGYGGGGFEIIDSGLKKISARLNAMIKSSKKSKVVLLAHGPPYKTRLDKIGKEYYGNKTLRKFIQDNKIDLVICGHFHENFGREDFIGKTRIINPGPEGKILVI